MRFTLSGDGIKADPGKRLSGRGIYLCRDSGCIEAALRRKAFNRACRRNVDTEEIKSVIEEMFSND